MGHFMKWNTTQICVDSYHFADITGLQTFRCFMYRITII